MLSVTDSLPFTILVTLFAIAVLVAVHEAGHFFVARWCGVKVLRFSVGFGKPIWRRLGRDGTEYVIAAIPLGGYVRMLDTRNETVSAAHLSSAFDQQNIYKRIAIVAAGPLINLAFAALLYSGVQYAGVPHLIPVMGAPEQSSIAAQAGLQSSQRIVAVDGVETASWNQVHLQLLHRLGDTGQIEILAQPLLEQELQRQAQTPKEQRNKQVLPTRGYAQTYQLPVQNWLATDLQVSPVAQLGLTVWRPQVAVVLERIIEGGAAEQAGLQAADQITHFNNEPVTDYAVFVSRVQASPNQLVDITFERQGIAREATLRLHSKELADGRLIGLIGVGVVGLAWPDSLLETPDLNIFQALGLGVYQVWQMMSLTLQTLQSMLVGQVSVEHLSGPISIAQVASSSASMGLMSFVSFMAYLSVSLGVLNLLPVPMLDGGHLLYYLIEMVTGKPVPDKVQRIGLRIGMMLVLMIMFIALFNDVARL
ncbi:MAG: RIP metalloprotease RseP [Gammaproteobacteria bacterium]|jgi:regulator of sigma E protease|nr:RIP metalloprotease RseP [Gammaproteobacteria bacterium]MCP4881493.1 RIP metalloprotease RseP [Gammaproteobacteria bacterium]MDP6166108.1 RIP metalloprotease RseP [Gammaproteobacteria bacterium]